MGTLAYMYRYPVCLQHPRICTKIYMYRNPVCLEHPRIHTKILYAHENDHEHITGFLYIYSVSRYPPPQYGAKRC
jgi:hypothetical protein